MQTLHSLRQLFLLTKFTSLARKLPAPIYKLAAQSYIDYNFPRHIFIETTANCNLACSYCPREKNKENMDFELFKEITEEASHFGPRSFSLHLFGEPLLYPHILQAIERIKTLNKRNTVLLTTNGTLLNKYAKELEMLRVDRIIWTWRRNNFDDNTLRLLRKRGLIRLLIEETPPDSFERFKKFPRVEIKHLHNYGGNIDVTKWGLKGLSNDARYPCYHLWLAPAVRWNGDITICCNDPNGRAAIQSYSNGGSLTSVWNSHALARTRTSHLSGEYSGICANCDSYKAYPNMFFGHQCTATTAASS